MLSRVAQSIYWMQRSIERAENVTRFVLVNYYLSLDMPDWMGAQWEPLIMTTGDQDAFKERYSIPNESNVLTFLLFDLEYPNSVLRCLLSAKENARSIQECINSEIFEAINTIVDKMNQYPKAKLNMEVLEELLLDIKIFSHYVSGCTDATFSHDESWQFKQLGAFMERADKTSRILDVKYFYLYPSIDDINTPLDNIPWFSLLNSTGSLEMYMRQHGLIKPRKVIEFLLIDPDYARSVTFCLRSAMEALKKITGNPPDRFTMPSEKALGSLYSEVRYQDTEYILNYGMHEYLDRLQIRLNEIGEAIHRDFFDVQITSDSHFTEQFQRQSI
jgi:uncharacterized alpha-E superfamily protein